MSERIPVLAATLTKLRFAIDGAMTQGFAIADWQLRMWIAEIDKLKADETYEERYARVRNSPVVAIAEDEVDLLRDPQWARDARAKAKRIAECTGHEAEAEPVDEWRSQRGWHPAHCKHCGKDMSVDSGD